MASDTTETKTKTTPRSRVAQAARARGTPAPAEAVGAGGRRGRAKGTRAAADEAAPVEAPAATTPARRGGRAKAAPVPPQATPAPDPVGAAAPDAGEDPAVTAAIAPPSEGDGQAAFAELAPPPDPTPGDDRPLLESEPLRTMEVSIQPQALKAGLADVVAVIPSRSTLPVLQHLLLTAEPDGHLRITATDLDTTVSRRVPAVVHHPGAVLVMGKKLHEIAREIPDNCTLDLRLKEDRLTLWCGDTRTRYRLPTMDVDEFPAPPGIAWENAFTVPGASLGLLIERTAFAASTEETRPILNGVLWEVADGEMGMVATNGHRLAVTRIDLPGATARPPVIVPPRALAMLARLPGEREQVQVAHGGNHLGFRGEGWETITRLIEGPYPDYRKVIPADNDKELQADKGTFTAAIRRMAIVASDQTHRVKVEFGGDPTVMRISVETPDIGAAHEDVAVDYQGNPLAAGFNAIYLLEVLRYLPPGEVRMTFSAPERAALITSPGDETGAHTEIVLMPLRLL